MNTPPAPCATYRVQFNNSFRFVDARDLIPYLSELGVTDVYSSPRYKARRGSSHCYDIANPLRVNPELGAEEDFDEMAEKLQHYGMGLILDTVPNHMAASYENPWWTDVLENGQASAYANYFDIDWSPKVGKAAFLQENRILLPVLGELYGDALENGSFSLRIEDTGIQVRYHEMRLPLDPKSYREILRRCPDLPELRELAERVNRLPDRNETEGERFAERRRDKDRIKELLWALYQEKVCVKRAVDEALQSLSGSADDLDRLLSQQVYRLACWKVGYEEINYRRFFDINDLVALRIELPDVFENRNCKTLELVRSGQVTGLRIDHIDGLWDPDCYLRRMRAQAGRPFYIVVEKILGYDEELPRQWPVSGTTGYDFLNAVNGVFIDRRGYNRLEEIYSRRTGSYLPFAELCYRCNKLVMQRLFSADTAALGRGLASLAAGHRQARDIRMSELLDALIEVTACLPVYRTYIHDFEVDGRDRSYIEKTIALARRRTSPEQVSDAGFNFLRAVLLVEPPRYLESSKRDWLEFVMRWQQFTGPVMAKGLEDTATYRHNSLLSLNEVGGDPLRERPPFDVAEFHEFNRRRREEWPDTMNATSTHDTKRSEDVRARLNVLSELPDEWDRRLERWMAWNEPKKEKVNGALAPSASEEFLIYQTLLGAWPHRSEDEPGFPARVKEFLVKAVREAKLNSSWISPHESYERALETFVDRILAPDSQFVPDFREFQQLVARFGARNSLSQLLLKIASPGAPDFYQGGELWQFTLVDPDNRRPVDYRRRIEMLEELRRRESSDRIALVRELAAAPQQDEMKLFVTYKALEFRKANRELFARGEYIPLRARGRFAENVCAFARRLESKWAAAIAPRWMSRVEDWDDTEVEPLEGSPGEWQDALTGLIPASWRLRDLLSEFPVALVAG